MENLLAQDKNRIGRSKNKLIEFLAQLSLAALNLLSLTTSSLLGFYYLDRFIWPGQIWINDLIGHVVPWLFLPLIVLVPAAILRRSKRLLILVTVQGALFIASYGHLYLPTRVPESEAPRIRVMAFNILYSNSQLKQIEAAIKSQQPDVLVLRELSLASNVALSRFLDDEFADSFVFPGGGVWSRYPILEREVWKVTPDSRWWAQRVQLQVENRRMEVVGVHMPYEPLLKVADLPGIPFNVPIGRAQVGTPAMEALMVRLAELQEPVVVMGDFNMSDQQDGYNRITSNLNDVHRMRGWGMGFSYAPLGRIKLTMLRIDYIFVSPDLMVMSTNLGDFGGSDHRPIVATLAWPLDE